MQPYLVLAIINVHPHDKHGCFRIQQYSRALADQCPSQSLSERIREILEVDHDAFVSPDNVVCRRTCADTAVQSKSPILIGAHYDAVIGCPGADDNATGLAVLLEMAKFFSENSAQCPIRLVAFDLEEFGLQGSFNYAAHLRERNQPLRLMLSLEMLGFCSHKPNSQSYPSFLKYFYPSTGNFIALVGDVQTIPEMWGMERQIKKSVPCEWLPAGWRGY